MRIWRTESAVTTRRVRKKFPAFSGGPVWTAEGLTLLDTAAEVIAAWIGERRHRHAAAAGTEDQGVPGPGAELRHPLVGQPTKTPLRVIVPSGSNWVEAGSVAPDRFVPL